MVDFLLLESLKTLLSCFYGVCLLLSWDSEALQVELLPRFMKGNSHLELFRCRVLLGGEDLDRLLSWRGLVREKKKDGVRCVILPVDRSVSTHSFFLCRLGEDWTER